MKKFISLIVLIHTFTIIHLSSQNTYALVIGISQYKEITPLQYADRDALAFNEFLKSQAVPEAHIKVYLNENATRVNILDGLYNLTTKAKPRDRFYFYFGGHGDLEAEISHENSLLLLYNSFKKHYFQGSEFIQLFELKEWLGALAQKQIEVVFIADACHSGSLIGGKEGISKTQTALQESWAGVTKILSCKSNEFSLEGKQWGGGRGLFSYNLVNGLTGRADANGDKKIAMHELNNYLTTNVLKQASPNAQTPVIMGNEKLVLSTVNTEGLAKLAEMEQKNFALLTEVNVKGTDKSNLDDLAKLDTTIVETYKKFAKALKDKRIMPHDDSLDNALIHYQKLETYNLPDNLKQMIKRNMGVGLMELELEVMRDVREKSKPFIGRNDKIISNTIDNLEEAMNIFGTSHPIYKNLRARILILQSTKFRRANTFKRSQEGPLQLKQRDHLLTSLELEPNMISTHSLLSTYYRGVDKQDSSIYHQEKVVKLLPNEGQAHLSLGFNYSILKYKDANNRSAYHPKAYEYLKNAIRLDSTVTMTSAYSMLGSMYMGEPTTGDGEWADTSYRNYLKAIPYYEKLIKFNELSDEEILKLKLNNYSSKNISVSADNPNRYKFFYFLKNASKLQFLYTNTRNKPKAEECMNKIKHVIAVSGSFNAYMSASQNIAFQYYREHQEIYLNHTLNFLQQALKNAEEAIKNAANEDKPFINVQCREILKSIGATHRALKNFTEAEKILHQSLADSFRDTIAKERFKLTNLNSMECNNRILTFPNGIMKVGNNYHYQIEANIEMFFLNLEQDKPDNALVWYEKALQNAVMEQGNYISTKDFTELVLVTYKNLNKEAFLKLRYKYFPDAEKTKYD